MKYLDEVRKCVGFVGYESQTTGEFVPAGTFFFLGEDPEVVGGGSLTVFVITARHVIDGLRRRGVQNVALRVNTEDAGAGTSLVPLGYWFCDPNDRSVDVSIAKIGVPDGADHLVFPRSLCMTKAIADLHEIGLGDEVYISGLFHHHYGRAGRNIPIVRVGNISSWRGEFVQTRLGAMDAYLVEARSIGGVSGSPAFLHLGQVRLVNNQFKLMGGVPPLYLIGLVHGHFDVRQTQIDETASDHLTEESINSGIAIVVPIEKIFEVIDNYYRAERDLAATVSHRL